MRATVASGQAGKTVAAVLRDILPGESWSDVRALCAAGRITLGGVVVQDSARRVVGGEELEIVPLGTARAVAADASEHLLVHLDRDVAVVRKPAGLLVMPVHAEDRDTLRHRAALAVRRKETAQGLRGSPTLRVVQRLDRETSGLLVFARTVPAERALQEQLKAHAIERRYLALVHGTARAAVHETFLVEDRGDGLRGSWGRFRAARGGPPVDARRAVTTVTVVEQFAGAALVACVLETGRQHQIRIHLAEAGQPLLGENVYIRDYREARLPVPRVMLHAEVLGFAHPRGGRPLRFEEPVPADFAAVLAALRRQRKA
jgi:23S rRNA pseudouridine1911/1915/1917 synthase